MSDTDFPFDPDDPRVTAYALDEMHDAEARAGFEQLLARSPEARALVDEIRALSGQLVAEYDEERRLAQAEPSNVIPLAIAERRQAAWAGRLLRMAATLAVLGIAGAMLAPYVRGPRAVQLHPQVEITMPVTTLDARIEDGALDQKRVDAAKKTLPAPQAVDGLRMPASVARGGVASQMALPYGSLNAPISSFKLSINGNVDQTATTRRTEPERPSGGVDGKAADESAMKDAPRGAYEANSVLKPAMEGSVSTAIAAAPVPAAPAAAPAVAGNALGGGGAMASGTMVLGDMPAPAKDASFQNRYANGDVNGSVAQSSVGSFKRLKAASEARFERKLNLDESGFVSSADAPVARFAIALNSDRQQNLGAVDSARELMRAPAVAGKTLGDFPFDAAPPAPGDPSALAVHAESASCPWAPAHRLIRIAFKGRNPPATAADSFAQDARLVAGAENARQVQVTFNPAEVAAYRLVGGGAGAIQLNAWQEATVLYEVVPAKAPQVEQKEEASDRLPVDRPTVVAQAARLRQLRAPGMLTIAVQPAAVSAGVLSDAADNEIEPEDISSASADFKFAAAVAAYDLASKAPRDKGAPSLDLAIQLAQEGLGKDPGGYRAAFLQSLRKAKAGQ